MSSNLTCFTREYKISLKFINYEENGMTLKLLPLFREFRMHAYETDNLCFTAITQLRHLKLVA